MVGCAVYKGVNSFILKELIRGEFIFLLTASLFVGTYTD